MSLRVCTCTRSILPLLAVGVWGCLGIGCRPSATVPPLGPDVVAMVAGHAITRADLEAAIKARSIQDPSRRMEVLKQLIEEESLYQAARASRFDQQPEVAAALRQWIIGRYREQSVAATNPPVTSGELEAAYAADPGRFTSPGMVSASMVYLRCSPKATAQARSEVETRAHQVWERAREASADQFSELVRTHSDDASTRYVGGRTGWMPESGGERLAPPVREALARLKEPGELAPLVGTTNGFYILRLEGRKAATVRPLSEVADALRYQLARRKAGEMERERISRLVQGVEVRINPLAVEAVSVRADAPAVPPAAPGLSVTPSETPKNP